MSAPRAFASGPKEHYNALLKEGKIHKDPTQEAVVEQLEALSNTLRNYTPVESAQQKPAPAAKPRQGGGFLSFFGRSAPEPAKRQVRPAAGVRAAERALHLGGLRHGQVVPHGPLLRHADPHHAEAPCTLPRVADKVHDRLHKKTQGKGHAKANTVWSAEAAKGQRESLKAGCSGDQEDKSDIMESVASDMVRESWLFCFDEFQVTHISDAMILKQLFTILFRKGAVLVSTSNRPPTDLYLNGLNRPLFVPFIPLLGERCKVIDIASETDYRLATDYAEDAFQVFYSPISKEQKRFFDEKFARFTRGQVVKDAKIFIGGRQLKVPESGKLSKVARFNFADLCDRALGAHDYINIAKGFHTVFIDQIPPLSLQERDQVRRFITLIDAFYEFRTKLVFISERKSHEIFSIDPSVDKKTAVQDEIFAWDRTVSRITEMSSIDYLRAHSQKLPYTEFWGQMDLSHFTDEEIDEAWHRYDVDDSGELDSEEMKVLLLEVKKYQEKKEHVDLSPSEFTDVWNAFDNDLDGTIDKDEFRSFVKKYSLKHVPPVAPSLGTLPELRVYQDGAKSKRQMQSTGWMHG
eukprot:CAMPEP_0179243954 /NCGR_PEP_ID=MMETSP0797-20121207/17808_1 /TAXON_ID=47934 /ORGANISM="Dinophysis acuminata, Strain DAEP01" /LENGTH=576 /DNA_ID=CAMNT_0020951455 /DNA_START=83 /DNA_END=1814 /DNA_ORIENTATION=+